MIRDVLGSTSVERLKGILQSRYGKGLEVSFLNDVNVVDLTGEPFQLKDGTLQIPIFSNGQFLAVAKVAEADSLPQTSVEAITEIVRLILEPALYNWFLNQVQNQQGHDVFHHVGGLEMVQDEAEFSPESEKSPVILITSKNPHRIPRVAMHAHETMNRWAFVQWNDVRLQIHTAQDLRDLGALTLLVNDVLILSDQEKDLLNDWVQTSDRSSQPALILGSSMGWDQLREEHLLPQALLHEAAFHQIEADRLPADRRFCEEAIKLLLDKEAGIHNH